MGTPFSYLIILNNNIFPIDQDTNRKDVQIEIGLMEKYNFKLQKKNEDEQENQKQMGMNWNTYASPTKSTVRVSKISSSAAGIVEDLVGISPE
ncbi:hypothetical protein FRX31_005134 [Thalictrum thalictroides]|uniref:Uncharacterized protein n=1 Tax=Thalictrum thalictroides TaxID=46969 RepID=A0A7J6X9W0_THATH|nr:hypothetical protein FRX31_005134 [Thalictrum thalictroides]